MQFVMGDQSRYRSSAFKFLIFTWIAVISALAMLYPLYTLSDDWRDIIQLTLSSKTTQGQVISHWIRTVESDDGVSYDYFVEYKYVAPPGDQFYTQVREVKEKTYRDASSAGSLKIKYDRDDHSLSYPLDDTLHLQNTLTFTVISLIFMAGALLGAFIFYLKRQEELALEKGYLVDGSIKDIHWSKGEDDYTITYQYHFESPTSGRILSGKSTRTQSTKPGKDLLPINTPTRILYASDDVHRLM